MRILDRYGITGTELSANMSAGILCYVLRGVLDQFGASKFFMVLVLGAYSYLASQLLFEKFTKNAIRRLILPT